MKRGRIILSVVAGVMVISAAGYFGFRSSKSEEEPVQQAPNTLAVDYCDVEQTVTAPGTVVNLNEVPVLMPVEGILDEILVEPGETVHTGDPLATIKSDPLRLAQAQSSVAEAQKKLDEAQIERDRYKNYTSTPETIEVARANLVIADKNLQDAQKEYNGTLEMSEKDPVRAQALIVLNNARIEFKKRQLALDLALASKPSDTAVAVADANLALAKANLSKAQSDQQILTNGVITAPMEGIVLKSSAETQKVINAGTSLFIIHNPVEIEIQASVVEEDLPYIQVGQEVELFFDALPEADMRGTVSRILPERASSDRPLYYIYISLNQIPDHLIKGMTVDSSVVIAQKNRVLCLPRALVRASSGDQANVEVWDGISIENRQVQVGLRGDVNIEVLSGLKAGEKVISK